MNKGIKEILEVFDALDLLAENGGKLYKDKKIDMSDLPVLIDLAVNAKVLLDAAGGLKEVVAEAKDLQSDELLTIASRLIQVGEKYEEARKG